MTNSRIPHCPNCDTDKYVALVNTGERVGAIAEAGLGGIATYGA